MSGIELARVVHSTETTDIGKVREHGVTFGNEPFVGFSGRSVGPTMETTSPISVRSASLVTAWVQSAAAANRSARLLTEHSMADGEI